MLIRTMLTASLSLRSGLLRIQRTSSPAVAPVLYNADISPPASTLTSGLPRSASSCRPVMRRNDLGSSGSRLWCRLSRARVRPMRSGSHSGSPASRLPARFSSCSPGGSHSGAAVSLLPSSRSTRRAGSCTSSLPASAMPRACSRSSSIAITDSSSSGVTSDEPAPPSTPSRGVLLAVVSLYWLSTLPAHSRGVSCGEAPAAAAPPAGGAPHAVRSRLRLRASRCSAAQPVSAAGGSSARLLPDASRLVRDDRAASSAGSASSWLPETSNTCSSCSRPSSGGNSRRALRARCSC
mmetsp:Transcript_19381/g.48743  ORF Transcript_19381/g.48743 Transcript_19381/m.48743 type:complete len:294 (+) Transcript_19381:206-1087(+)